MVFFIMTETITYFLLFSMNLRQSNHYLNSKVTENNELLLKSDVLDYRQYFERFSNIDS